MNRQEFYEQTGINLNDPKSRIMKFRDMNSEDQVLISDEVNAKIISLSEYNDLCNDSNQSS